MTVLMTRIFKPRSGLAIANGGKDEVAKWDRPKQEYHQDTPDKGNGLGQVRLDIPKELHSSPGECRIWFSY
jgi:hypothetical protein